MGRHSYEVEQEETEVEAYCSQETSNGIPITPDLWFSMGEAQLDAVFICKQCPLQLKCAEYAIEDDEEFGVWGGLTAFDRRKMRKSRTRRGVPNKKH